MASSPPFSKFNHEGAIGRSLLLGITKASLSTDGFVSVASLQKTTRVPTDVPSTAEERELGQMRMESEQEDIAVE